jgi:hypothetical protein
MNAYKKNKSLKFLLLGLGSVFLSVILLIIILRFQFNNLLVSYQVETIIKPLIGVLFLGGFISLVFFVITLKKKNKE